MLKFKQVDAQQPKDGVELGEVAFKLDSHTISALEKTGFLAQDRRLRFKQKAIDGAAPVVAATVVEAEKQKYKISVFGEAVNVLFPEFFTSTLGAMMPKKAQIGDSELAFYLATVKGEKLADAAVNKANAVMLCLADAGEMRRYAEVIKRNPDILFFIVQNDSVNFKDVLQFVDSNNLRAVPATFDDVSALIAADLNMQQQQRRIHGA